MAKCKNCGEGDKTWTQDSETSKWRLLNADGSRHFCMNNAASTTTTTAAGPGPGNVYRGQQTTQQQPVQVHPTPEEWNALYDKIGKMAETISMQAKFYEDLVTEMQTVSKAVHKSFLVQDKADQFLQECRITDAKIDRILTRVDSIAGTRIVEYDEQQREQPRKIRLKGELSELARQEEEYDRDKEDGLV